MQQLFSSVITIALLSVIGFLLDFIMPSGNMKRLARFACSLVLTLAISISIAGLFSLDFSAAIPEFKEKNIFLDQSSIQNAVKQYIRLYAGFEKAEVSVSVDENKLVSVMVSFPYDNAEAAAKRKLTENQMRKTISVLYNVEANKIIIQ